MAVYKFRNVLGGAIPLKKAAVVGAYVKGCPVYRNISDGKLTTVATNGTKLLGFLAEASAADGDIVAYVPMLPGIEVLMDFSDTYLITDLGTYVAITVTSGVPVADIEDKSNDILKLEELDGTLAEAGKAWFSVAHSADQTTIETA